ncbi:hypothetical protein NMG60_11000502 [Bertholletia excelsa]
MKVSTKVMSSPSRAEKFPPPLMRFLRSNVGSRSRGRSRSSPMFVRKKNMGQVPEPSSPKVTCMGQVRTRRSSKQSASGGRGRWTRAQARRPCYCWWVRKTVETLRPGSFRPIWRKCLRFFRFGFCRRAGDRASSLRAESNRKGGIEVDNTEDQDEEEDYEAGAEAPFNLSSPPKNALILTRCRSAPYRSSSLASRFWGSPLTNDQHSAASKVLQQGGPTSESEPNCRDPDSESKMSQSGEENPGISRESEGLINGRTRENEEKDEGGGTGITGRPVILTRSKSEPSYWRQRRRLDAL